MSVPISCAASDRATGGDGTGARAALLTYLRNSAILASNELFLGPCLMRSDATQTVPVGLPLFQGDKRLRYGQMAAASLSHMLRAYLLALSCQRRLVRILTGGAVT